MRRSSRHTDSLLGMVRAYYGLLQWELAGYLGVSPTVYPHLESGRRSLSVAFTERVLPLLTVRPPVPPPLPGPTPTPPEPLPEPPPPGAGALLKPGPLADRLADCRYHAARLRRAARPYAWRARYAARWAAAMPTLVVTLPATAANAAAAARTRAWLSERPVALLPYELTEWHLLLAQATGLEAEAAALEAVLAGAPAAPPA